MAHCILGFYLSIYWQLTNTIALVNFIELNLSKVILGIYLKIKDNVHKRIPTVYCYDEKIWNSLNL